MRNGTRVIATGPAEHPRRHPVLVARMTDADPRTMKTAVPQVRDDVAQAVLTAVTAIELEPCNTCRQVALVMRVEALLGLDLPVPQGASDALTTAIHAGGRWQQAHIVLADAQA